MGPDLRWFNIDELLGETKAEKKSKNIRLGKYKLLKYIFLIYIFTGFTSFKFTSIRKNIV